MTITVDDDELTVDFAGTAAQTEGYANAPYASSASATLRALVTLVGARIPRNDGMLRAVTMRIPRGSMLNPEFPAATFYGNFMAMHIYEAIVSAMGGALPNVASAAWNRAYDVRTAGLDPRTGRMYGDIHFLGLKGGTGAVRGVDGYNQGAPVFAPALRTQDYEINECQYPHFLIRHEYLTDSAGAGQWRGGLGVEYEVRLDAHDLTAVTQGDGLLEGARGVHGGGDGVRNRLALVAPEAEERVMRAMEVADGIPRGTLVRQQAGGGGGYGDPFARPVDLVVRDVDAEISRSVAAAAADYGVVVTFDATGAARADETATARLRADRATPAQVERVGVSDGCSFASRTRGDGPPVLLLHAGGEDASGWTAQAEALAAAGYRAVAYDRRGTRHSGRDGWPGGGAPGHARDAAELLHALGLGPVTALGVSSGAFVALDLALAHPDLVELAVVHEPPAFQHVEDGMAHFARLQSCVDTALAETGDYAAAYRAFLEDAHGPSAVEQMPPKQWAMEAANAEAFMRDDLPLIALRHYSEEDLMALRKRVHVTSGSESAPFLRAAARALAEPGRWTHELLRAQGHTPHVAAPGIFVDVVGACRAA